jgi:hypothetical protein
MYILIYLLIDNGHEFKGEFTKFCGDNHIMQMLTKSHSPTENEFIRKKIILELL